MINIRAYLIKVFSAYFTLENKRFVYGFRYAETHIS